MMNVSVKGSVFVDLITENQDIFILAFTCSNKTFLQVVALFGTFQLILRSMCLGNVLRSKPAVLWIDFFWFFAMDGEDHLE